VKAKIIASLRLRCVDQELGRFATLVGPNASGKMTFLDVIALLGDLMRNGGQVRLATDSPISLAMLDPKEVLCSAKDEEPFSLIFC
jgi:predicted ATPase